MWKFRNINLSTVCVLEKLKNRCTSVNECDKFLDLNVLEKQCKAIDTDRFLLLVS